MGIIEYKNIVRKLDKETYKSFRSLLIKTDISKTNLRDIDTFYAEKNMEMGATITLNDKNIVNKIYKDPLEKVERLLRRKDLLESIGGLKILLYGKTGSGKTSFANELKNRNKNYDFDVLNLEEIVSSKMGQTQLNLFNLSNNLSQKDKLTIIFIDELDSIIGDRKNEESGERKKIASTFLKILDSLKSNIVLISATNYIEDIDPSIVRRFNFKVKGYEIKIEDSLDFIDEILGTSMYRKKTTFKKYVNQLFTVSDIYTFVNHIKIEKEFSKDVDVYKEFMKMFKEKFTNLESFDSKRAREIANEKL